MKTTNLNKAIIYDDNCPQCAAYTKAFIKGGFLQKENRISFSEVNMQQFKIDWQRAKHEIPVIDLKTGEVKYGVDALAEILQQKIFFVQPLLNVKIIYWFMKQLYKLISYNRKIIVASTPTASVNFDCTPNYSFFWRSIFIAVCFLLNVFFLTGIFKNFSLHFPLQNILLIGSILFITMLTFYKITRPKIITEVCSHFLISTLITCFLILFLSFCTNYFHLSNTTFFLLCIPISLILLQQFKKRYTFMRTHSIL